MAIQGDRNSSGAARLFTPCEPGGIDSAAAPNLADFATAAGHDWCALQSDGLQIWRAAGVVLPPSAGLPRDQNWQFARALRGAAQNGRLSVASGSLGQGGFVALAVPEGESASRAVQQMAIQPLHDHGDSPWDVLGGPARLASTWLGRGKLYAAAVSFKGHGRILGPVNPDLLIGFGVSNWR